MNDTYRRKATADEYDTLDPSTGLCSGFNALSFGCVSSKSRIPPFGEDVEIVNVDRFCAAGPYPDPGDRPDIADAAGDPNTTYFGELSAWGKAHARRIKFAQWCELAPPTGAECQNGDTPQVQTYSTTNSDYTGWIGIYTFENQDTKIEQLTGDVNTTYAAGARCQNGVAADGGITRLKDGQDNGCLSASRGGGRTLTADFYYICATEPEDIPEPETPPEEPPETPPPTSLPPVSTPGPEGPAGPPGIAGPEGPPGPCPTIQAGDLIVGAGEEDELLITDEGDCTYTMSIRLRDLASEERTVLKGVQYSVTEYPDHASFQFVNGGLYFIPRCGAIVFKNNATGERSESQEIHMDSGYVRNPDRLKFDNYDLTPYVSTFIIASNGDRDIVNVLTTTLIPSD